MALFLFLVKIILELKLVCFLTKSLFYVSRFEWLLPLNEVKQRTLDIQVKNKNSMFSKARVHMGQVVINLADTDLAKASTEW